MQVHMVMYFYQAFVTNFFIAKYATNIAKRMLRKYRTRHIVKKVFIINITIYF